MKKIFAILASAIILLAVPSKTDAQTLRDKYGSQIGTIENNGTIRDKYGSQVGKIDSNNTVRDKYGSQIGKIDNDGTIRDKYGSSIGSARGVPKTWAGLYFFFSLN